MDLYTIQKALGRLTNLKIGFVGDLKYGRTVHSLVRAMSNFFPEMTFISLPELALPVSYIEDLNSRGIKFKIVEDLRSIISELDVLYVTRIQKERFPDIMEYEKVKGKYRLDSKMIKNAKESLIVLHPLPRVDEIDQSFDCEKGALYFTQAHNAVPVRQALLGWVLGVLK